jgi:abortive infection bacteriophage resistance protein
MNYEIQKHIPVPVVKRGRKKKDLQDYELPLHLMEVNDSIGTKDNYNAKNASKWRSKIIYIIKKMQLQGLAKMQFTIKEYEGKVRIWRVS